jgi:hypothetical protein
MAITSYDDITSLVAAYATRKVVAAYAGDCLRLRRSSDDAESDFGFSGDDLDTAAIATWLSAATGYVVTWYDQSGNGHDATQSDATKQFTYLASGINGKPVLVSDNSDDYLACDSLAGLLDGASTPWAVAAVAQIVVDGGAHTLFGLGRSSTTQPFHHMVIGTTGYFGGARRNDSGAAVAPSSLAPFTDGANKTLAMTYDGTQTLHANATMQGMNRVSSAGTATFDMATIGALRTGATYNYPFGGQIGELAIYSKQLSASELQDIAFFQNSYWACFTDNGLRAYNVSSALTIPTPVIAAGRTLHPDVHDAGAGNTLFGHRFWMIHTPYNGDAQRDENPCIAVSADGDTWTEPVGITNPIAGPPVDGNYGDVDLLLAQDGKLYAYWFRNQTTDSIGVADSADGVTWSAERACLTPSANAGSPSVIWDGTQYVLYVNHGGSSPNVLRRYTSSSPDGGWSGPTNCTYQARDGRELWDFNITYEDGTYHGWWSMTQIGQNGYYVVIYHAESADGIDWTVDDHALMNPETLSGQWDNDILYRPCAVPQGDGTWDFYYSGRALPEVWHMGRTTVTLAETPPVVTSRARVSVVWIG